MPETFRDGEQEPLRAGVVLWLIVSWLWVGIPLAWGVWQTVIKSSAFFTH